MDRREKRLRLHVVRLSRSGTAYVDTIEHLSESEREITGFVFALTGYLVYQLRETMPVMLLDPLEAVDADRIATLIEHFSEYAEHVIIAPLPKTLPHSPRSISASPTSERQKNTVYTLLVVHYLYTPL